MLDINGFTKYNKLNLYKNGLKKFIDMQIDTDTKWNKVKLNLSLKLNNLDYVIGILFLTEMNRNCKNNNISIHGYYVTCGLMNFFSNIQKKLLYGKKISSESIIFLFNGIANNVDYLNSRIDANNPIRKKINENLSNLFIEITPLINDIVYFKKTHNDELNLTNYELNNKETIWEIKPEIHTFNNINNIGSCNKNCHGCWVDEILTKFNYVLLIIAKFMGTGNVKDPNLYKLSEYYSNIFYVILKLDTIDFLQINEHDDLQIKKTQIFYQYLFTNYQDYKSKLIYSNMELNINSDTVDEIINYLDTNIMNKFLNKNILLK